MLGTGGLGSVYLAEQSDLSRKVAIKILHASALADSEYLERFEQEARILSALQHEHIVRVYSIGFLDSGSPYMVMEHLDGCTLDRLSGSTAPLAWRRAVGIIMQVCRAAAFAHARGIIHRDLKPQNIMLVKSPEPDFVKILDFGLSKMIMNEKTVQKLTSTGMLIGSLHYMSPELCQGRKADHRSDIYSLGCTLYECLSGTPPLTGEHPLSVIEKHLNVMPRPLSSFTLSKSERLPPGLEKVVFKSIQKDPSQRFQTMLEFEQALQLVLDGRESELTLGSISFSKGPASAGPGKQIVISVLVCLGLLLGIGLPLSLHYLRPRLSTESIKGDRSERARNFLQEADALKGQGKGRLAEKMVRRALLAIAYDPGFVNAKKQAALDDLSLLDRTREIIRGVPPAPGTIRDSGLFDAIKAHDPKFLTLAQQAAFFRDLTEIYAFYGFLFEALETLVYSTRLYASMGDAQQCELLIEQWKYFPEGKIGEYPLKRAVYLNLARGYLQFARHNLKGAQKYADDVSQILETRGSEMKTRLVASLLELGQLEIMLSRYDKAESTLGRAQILADQIRDTHPESAETIAIALSQALTLQHRDKEAADVLAHEKQAVQKSKKSLSEQINRKETFAVIDDLARGHPEKNLKQQ